MKSVSTLAIFIIISSQIFSQQKFIEISVSDTVQVKPDLFVYTIIINRNSDNNYDEDMIKNSKSYNKKEAELQNEQLKLFDSLKTVITNKGFRILPYSLSASVLIPGEDDNKNYTINVVTTTEDSVKMVYDIIKNVRFIYSYLRVSEAKDETPYYNYLYKKLIEDAKKKANAIAEINNQKLGSIFSVSELTENETRGWTAYPPLSALETVIPGWHTTIQDNSYKVITDTDESKNDFYVIRQSFTVRFNIE